MNCSPTLLAREFCRQMVSGLSMAQMSKVRLLNALENDKGICHSHDFCDANQVMLDAMEVFGLDFDTEESTVELINQAWDMAKAADFYDRSCFAVGALIKFQSPETDLERQAVYRVVELRGVRVLAEEVRATGIAAQSSLLGADIVGVE